MDEAVHSPGTLDLVIDSTGLKVYGEGEWKMRTHGKKRNIGMMFQIGISR